MSKQTKADIIKAHYSEIGEKGGKAGKGSERRLWAARLGAAIRWNNAEKIAIAKAKLEALHAS